MDLMGVALAEVRDSPVGAAELLPLVSRPGAGAVALFVGTVRDHDPQASGEVVSLDYTCHPSAPERIGQIVADVLHSADPDGACTAAVVHRVGHLIVGDVAFVVAVSSPHRALAFDVCERIVEAVKTHLPVWKQQFEADGSHHWSGL